MHATCRGTVRSHDDHDNFDGKPYSPLVPHKHNSHLRISLNQGGIDYTKLLCLVQQQPKFSHFEDHMQIPYQDLLKLFNQRHC